MSQDIIERLRDPSAFPDNVRADCAEAADEIERLLILNEKWKDTCKRNADEIERLRKQIEDMTPAAPWDGKND